MIKVEADASDRPVVSVSPALPVCGVDLTGDRKLGYGFTSADELEEVDIGPGDKPRPTFISKKLDPQLRGQMIALLKEYPDCCPPVGFDRNKGPRVLSTKIFKVHISHM
jgi:hypothetical protein